MLPGHCCLSAPRVSRLEVRLLYLENTFLRLLDGLWLCDSFDSIVIDLESAVCPDSGERLYLLNLTLCGRYWSLCSVAYHWLLHDRMTLWRALSLHPPHPGHVGVIASIGLMTLQFDGLGRLDLRLLLGCPLVDVDLVVDCSFVSFVFGGFTVMYGWET